MSHELVPDFMFFFSKNPDETPDLMLRHNAVLGLIIPPAGGGKSQLSLSFLTRSQAIEFLREYFPDDTDEQLGTYIK
jgi:hypothetical protein